MPKFKTKGFKSLSVSDDGIVLEMEFAVADGEDLVVEMPAVAWPLVAPFFEQANAAAAQLREAAAASDGEARGGGASN